MPANSAYRYYSALAKAQGKIPMQQQRFGEEMRKEGVQKSRTKDGQKYALAINTSQRADFDADFLELN